MNCGASKVVHSLCKCDLLSVLSHFLVFGAICINWHVPTSYNCSQQLLCILNSYFIFIFFPVFSPLLWLSLSFSYFIFLVLQVHLAMLSMGHIWSVKVLNCTVSNNMCQCNFDFKKKIGPGQSNCRMQRTCIFPLALCPCCLLILLLLCQKI